MRLRKLAAVAVLAMAMAVVGQARAEEVSHVYQGRTLVAELTLAEGKVLQDGIILMVHGTLAHKDMEIMKSLREALRDRGHSTLAINLSLGLSNRHGMYDCATPHRHKHTEALTDIGAWLTWLHEQKVDSVTLMGHSRGGNQVAWYAFEKDAPLVKSLVLLAPMTWTPGRDAKAYKERYGVDLKTVMRPAERLVGVGRGHEMLEGIDFLNCPKATVAAGALVDYYIVDQRRDTPALLGGIYRPILVIAGSKDTVFPDLPEKVAAREHEHVTLRVIEGADHFFQDLFVEDVADAVVEFLAKTAKAAAK